jgi:hypothetical protein
MNDPHRAGAVEPRKLEACGRMPLGYVTGEFDALEADAKLIAKRVDIVPHPPRFQTESLVWYQESASRVV